MISSNMVLKTVIFCAKYLKAKALSMRAGDKLERGGLDGSYFTTLTTLLHDGYVKKVKTVGNIQWEIKSARYLHWLPWYFLFFVFLQILPCWFQVRNVNGRQVHWIVISLSDFRCHGCSTVHTNQIPGSVKYLGCSPRWIIRVFRLVTIP